MNGKNILRIEDIEDWTIMGYPVKDLLIFADACRRRGLQDWEIIAFAENARNAVDYALEVVKDVKRA